MFQSPAQGVGGCTLRHYAISGLQCSQQVWMCRKSTTSWKARTQTASDGTLRTSHGSRCTPFSLHLVPYSDTRCLYSIMQICKPHHFTQHFVLRQCLLCARHGLDSGNDDSMESDTLWLCAGAGGSLGLHIPGCADDGIRAGHEDQPGG